MTFSVNLSQQDKKPSVLMFNKEGGFLRFSRRARDSHFERSREVSLLRGISPHSQPTVGSIEMTHGGSRYVQISL